MSILLIIIAAVFIISIAVVAITISNKNNWLKTYYSKKIKFIFYYVMQIK